MITLNFDNLDDFLNFLGLDNINSIDKRNCTVLNRACSYNLEKIVKLILESPSFDITHVNKKDSQKYTPFMIACSNENVEIIKMLLYNENFNTINDGCLIGLEPVGYICCSYSRNNAEKKKKIIRMIVEHPSFSIKNKITKILFVNYLIKFDYELLKIMIYDDKFINLLKESNYNDGNHKIFEQIVLDGDLKSFKLILENNIFYENFNEVNLMGNTILHELCYDCVHAKKINSDYKEKLEKIKLIYYDDRFDESLIKKNLNDKTCMDILNEENINII